MLDGSSATRRIIGILLAVFAAAMTPASATDATILVKSAKTLFDDGDYEAAEEALKLALDGISEAEPRRYSACLQNIAYIEFLNYHFLESEKLYEKALNFTTQASGDDSLDLANNLYGLSRSMRRQNKLAEAEPILQRIASIRLKQLGAEHRLVSNSYFDLAVNSERIGKPQEAISYYGKTLCIREKLYGKTSKALTPLVESYCSLLQKCNNDKAPEMFERLQCIRTFPGPDVVLPPKEADGNGWIDLD